MVLSVVGFALMVSSILHFLGEYTNINGVLPNLNDSQNGMTTVSTRPMKLTFALGLAFVVMGVCANTIGAYNAWDRKYLLLAAFGLFSMTVQTRLVVYWLTNKNAHQPTTKENGLTVLGKAFSIGIFPKGNLILSVLVQLFQLLTVVAISAFILG